MRTYCMLTLWLAGTVTVLAAPPEPLTQEPNTWVKRSPLKGGPVSPSLGYETSMGYDPIAKRVIRFAGHNQGGGGEQNAEVWTFDPVTARWALQEPNTSPPGSCCNNQNVFDLAQNRFIRFPAFSGSHGWHWFRENYLTNSSLWNYDLASNTWRNLRPLPEPRIAPLRCAAWDSDHQVVVVFGGEGSQDGTLVYDPYVNTWTRMNTSPQPAFRSGGNMAYDASHKRHILFGYQLSRADAKTWAYDLRKNRWHDMKPATSPPTDQNDAVLAYDSRHRVVVASVQAIDQANGQEIVKGHYETWVYDTGKNTWTAMKPSREPDGWGNRRRVMLPISDQNVILMESYINPTTRVPGIDREQQIWTYRYAESKAEPALLPPTGLRVTTSDKAALLEWNASASPEVAGYVVYRGEGDKPWMVEYRTLRRLERDQTSLRDTGLKPGTIYFYCVRAVGRDSKESDDSLKVCTQPRVVEDTVVSVPSASEVQITWPKGGGDIVGYHVERAPVEVFSEDQVFRLKTDTPPLDEPSVGAIKAIGTFTRLTKEPIKGNTYTDGTVDLRKPQTVEGEPLFRHRFRIDEKEPKKGQIDPKGKPYRFAVYAYRIRAVNSLGVESGPSPYYLTIPSSPQWFFSREEGEQCHLKWTANPERGIRGYRVYRMEGPKLNGPGQKVTRLTAEPITELRYTDGRAGKDTRRYWVVAVDALGQEGMPSAPTWHYRQWQRFYVPFVKEWHQ